MRYVYPCNIRRDEEEAKLTGREAYNVTFPDLPEAITCGWSWDEAVEMAEDVLGLCLAHYCVHEGHIPHPQPPRRGPSPHTRSPLSRCQAHYQFCYARKGNHQQALGQKLGIGEDAVRRLLDPNSRTHFTQVEKALRAVGRSLIIEDAPITEPARIPVAG